MDKANLVDVIQDKELRDSLTTLDVLPKGKELTEYQDSLRIFNADFICKSVFVLVALDGPVKKLDSISKTLDCSIDKVYECVEVLLDINLIKFTENGYTALDQTSSKLTFLNLDKLSSSERRIDHRDRMIYFCNEYKKGNFKKASDYNYSIASDLETVDWLLGEQKKLMQEFFERSKKSNDDILVETIGSLMAKEITKGNN